MNSDFLKIKHLYNRFGFGISNAIIQRNWNLDKEITDLLSPGSNYQKLETISTEEVEKADAIFKNNTNPNIKDLKQLLKKNVFSLNHLWLNEMINNEDQLREKMSLFWHSNLACRSANPYFDQLYLDIIRQQALGNFGDLLKAVSKTPAMLQFLNGQQNRKEHPNENFAREVMELFTLGRGNYTEQDVKEAARAFTGWGFDKMGNFKFRWQWHDADVKTIFGKSGNFTGDDVLEMLLDNKQTALHITQKIYRYFINETVNPAIVQSLADEFYQSGYDIKKLLHSIILSTWFYDEMNIGNRIKSPIELFAGMMRVVPIHFDNDESVLFIERALNQILLNPPNVAGWKGGTAWIDSSSLLLRMKLPQYLYYDAELNFAAKEITPEMGSNLSYKTTLVNSLVNSKLKGTPDWSNVEKTFSSKTKKEISEYLLATPVDTILSNLLAQTDTITNTVRSRVIYTMCLPEYQLK